MNKKYCILKLVVTMVYGGLEVRSLWLPTDFFGAILAGFVVKLPRKWDPPKQAGRELSFLGQTFCQSSYLLVLVLTVNFL
jgi:hypothetical protein